MAGSSIKKGDTVQVLTGKDRGKQGRVVRVYPKTGRIMVEGVNVVKRHERVRPAQGRAGTTGGIITKDMPIDLSNVGLVCSACDRPARIGHAHEGENKERICARCGGKL